MALPLLLVAAALLLAWWSDRRDRRAGRGRARDPWRMWRSDGREARRDARAAARLRHSPDHSWHHRPRGRER
jgi:hypothetical protein